VERPFKAAMTASSRHIFSFGKDVARNGDMAGLETRSTVRLFSLLAVAIVATAQVVGPGPQVLTFLSDVDDTDQPYALYLPKQYNSERKYPLVISLHGAYSNHRLNLRRVFGRGNRIGETDAEATRYWPAIKDVDFIVASPLARGTMGYKGVAEKDVYDVLAVVKRRFSVDEDRVYLTGLSMGGGGALWLGLTHPDVWAAIAAVCPAVPPGTEPLAGNAGNVPVKLFQGELDPLVPVKETRRWQELLTDAGVKSEYVEYKGVRHNAWDVAYKDAAIFDWFGRYKRVRFPERVRFAANSFRHGSAYWVRFDVFTPGTLASIDARFSAAKRLTITTKELDAFTLTLKGHPMSTGAGVLAVTVDGSTLKTRVADRVSFEKGPKGWQIVRTPAKVAKRAGAEGPISDALAARHIYVYGTGGNPDDGELQRRKLVAQQAAEWSTTRLKLLLTFRVMADNELKATDIEQANLVLFGTKETNSVIAKYSSALPLSLNAGAADYGLVYVYPVENRYVVVNSGLPWWTRFDLATRFELPFLNAPQHALATFGDYFVFRGGLDNVVTEGRFGRDWKLPANAATKLRALGAIEVR
jgi:predicted esterase